MHAVAPWLAALPGPEIVVVMFALAWGAMLGSFVNVVAHRVPRGESVVRGRSRCPACGARIRARDNLPVLGWLLLHGRCRDCRTAISPAYPAVEVACGSAAAVLAWAELVGGGRWLPRWHDAAGRFGVDRILQDGDWPLVVVWALHTSIVATIVAWSLLERQGHGVSPSVLATAVAVVALVIVAVPAAGPIDVIGSAAGWPTAPTRMGSLVATLTGAAAGLLVGRLFPGTATSAGLAVVGAAAGWQAVTIVAVVTAAGWGVERSLREDCGPGLPLTAAATSLLAAWSGWHTAWVSACRTIFEN